MIISALEHYPLKRLTVRILWWRNDLEVYLATKRGSNPSLQYYIWPGMTGYQEQKTSTQKIFRQRFTSLMKLTDAGAVNC